ncbi:MULTISPECIES: LD-carboxypeptidase [Sphingobacterium]|uniref:LD-carboxypeptidase n=1 Tax=Sphingobacterium litopenaei TaxID=2763500 RepID=A0ABR7YDY3_9SPHI|nr:MULTISPECIES: LD-carboxypeptidase [Sphingobacterium]MBD1429499.1 LD-carboxypeptidase [Sphingobacterium litopenaei]NGM72674.1 LD-carboxypeptidase [Sphingobacterium sp. SGL-16]
MNTPQPLKKGDKIAVICPASYISVDLTEAYEVLKNWGLEPIIYSSVTAQHHQFAGSDTLRAKDFQEALDNPEIKAIIAGRGGYGCVRIIDQIDFSSFEKRPKWIVGFSDITAIHSHIQHNFQIPTIHGQMVKSFLDASEESLTTLRNALFGENVDISYSNSIYPNRNGTSKGILTGGNLALLQSVLASPSDVDYEGKILFIEDVGESHYNIDRMLWTLKRAGKLDKLAGLIVGGFTDLKDSDPAFGQRFEDIIMDKVREYEYPIAFGFPAGHMEDNRALILGKEVQLTVEEEKITLTYL